MEVDTKTTNISHPDRVSFPFWLKLTLFSICVTSVILVGVFYFVYNEIKNTTEEELIADIYRTDKIRRLIEEQRELHFSQIASEMKYNSILVSFIRESTVTSDEDLFGVPEQGSSKETLKEANEKILSTLKNNYRIFDKSDVFILINRNGEILLNKNNPKEVGKDINSWKMVSEIIAGKENYHTFWMNEPWSEYLPEHSKDKLYDVSAVPLKDQQGIYGIMIKGIELGQKYFEQFQFNTESPSYLSFLSDNEIKSSQFDPWLFKSIEKELMKKMDLSKHDPDMIQRLRIKGEEYLFKWSPIENHQDDMHQIALMKNFTQPFEKKLSQFLKMMLNIVLIASLLTILLSFILSRYLTSSIHALIDGVRKIGQGDLDARVQVNTKDELGVLANSFNHMGEELKTGEFLEGAMKKYISSDLVDDLKQKQHLLELGGENQKLSIYFSDIVAFTPIAEKLKPEELIEWLNQYMSTMTDIIKTNKGTIDKFIGDAIMAFWNAPRPIENHCQHAANAALDQIRFLKGDESLTWSNKIDSKVFCRIGLHYGEAIVGNVGSENRISYTAIGDDINLASRLEGVNRKYDTNILISESFYKELGPEYICRTVDKVVVVGKTKPVKIFELLETREHCDDKISDFATAFSEMIEVYWSRNFKEALKQIDSFDIQDRLTDMYRERCQNYINNPPPENWRGETAIRSK